MTCIDSPKHCWEEVSSADMPYFCGTDSPSPNAILPQSLSLDLSPACVNFLLTIDNSKRGHMHQEPLLIREQLCHKERLDVTGQCRPAALQSQFHYVSLQNVQHGIIAASCQEQRLRSGPKLANAFLLQPSKGQSAR